MPSKMFLSLAVAGMAIALYAVPALTAEKATDIPKDTYYNDPLTASERSGIASGRECLSQRRRQSLPTPQDEGVIPDAGDKADRDAAIETPAQNLKEDTDRSAEKRGESEANAILDESKKDFKVTKKDLADCLKDWDPQTQMSKEEWAESCRTTLEYFPDGQ